MNFKNISNAKIIEILKKYYLNLMVYGVINNISMIMKLINLNIKY